jgi:hypothetical protein
MVKIIISSVLAVLSLASTVAATTYAQFCNDQHCTDSCGISVSVSSMLSFHAPDMTHSLT